MPRDGLQQYSPPPGTEGIANYTVESARYNTFVADITFDLNYPRPISAGGTGASSADAALLALSGEKAKQVVTNWDSTAWLPGSFYAPVTATGNSPIGAVPPTTPHAFAGIAYYANASDFVIEAIDLTSTLNPKWFRIMSAGVWGAWQPINAGLYVSKAGDTMAGPLLLPATPLADNTLKAATTAFVNQDAFILVGVDFNTITKTGTYACQNVNSNPNEPTGAGQWYLEVRTYGGDVNYVVQHATNMIANTADEYTRVRIGGAWGPWQQVAPLSAVVRYDAAQTLTAPQQVQARQNIYAAPFDALAYNGMQINGSMAVDQTHTSVTWLTMNNAWTTIVDGWVVSATSAGATIQSAPQSQASFPNSGGYNALTVITPVKVTAFGTNEWVAMGQAIEGYRMRRVSFGKTDAQPITIGFWALSSQSGTATAVLKSLATTRGCPVNFTLVAGVPKWVTLTFPPDTGGTWYWDNQGGAFLIICFGCGPNLNIGTNGVWANNNAFGTPQTTNFFPNNNDYASIGNVVVLPGIEAPSAAQSGNIMRPYDQDLILCKRYWQKLGGTINTPAEIFMDAYQLAGQGIATTLTYPVEMRIAPNGAIVGSWLIGNVTLPLTLNGVGTKSCSISGTATANGTTYFYTRDATTYITLDARLV